MENQKTAGRRAGLDRALRRVVPSVSQLTYRWYFRAAVNPISRLADLFFPEFRKLPPAHLRARVGTGNRIFWNQALYLRIGIWYWLDSFSRGLLDLSSEVVEIGCGCGKMFQHLHNTEQFTGTFTGIDIDDEMLAWCRKAYTRPGFQFIKLPHGNSAYAPRRRAGRPEDLGADRFWSIPLADGGTDFVYSSSLLTHLLEPQAANYLRESHRLLRPGGALRMSFFCFDTVEKGNRWTFGHRIGEAFVESPLVPEAAVAYTREKMERLCRDAGFADVELRLGARQSEVIGRKR